ncbi:MAG: hydrogenase maturation protease [Desulfobacteraceae bacterium]|jgi:hydrogenase maturation protease|nr:hydrogenase maturation protease [Desulfobacteraceae bacterium]
MSSARAPSFDFWIIGYGNPQRRDDGIGPHIVKRLQPVFEHRTDVHLLVLHQLEPDIIDTLKSADTLVFVDATVDALTEGRHWVEVKPELNTMPFLIHQTAPAFILGLLQGLYHRHPKTWLVSVAGQDFRFGSGLSFEAQQRAEQVISEIAEFVLTEVSENDRINRKGKPEAPNAKYETILKS